MFCFLRVEVIITLKVIKFVCFLNAITITVTVIEFQPVFGTVYNLLYHFVCLCTHYVFHSTAILSTVQPECRRSFPKVVQITLFAPVPVYLSTSPHSEMLT